MLFALHPLPRGGPKRDTLPLASQPSFHVRLEGLLAGHLIKDVAGFIKFSFHQLPSAVSGVCQRSKFGILRKSLTPLSVLVNVAKPPSGGSSSVADHPRCTAMSGKFWPQIAETRLTGFASEDTYYSREEEGRSCGSTAPLGPSRPLSSSHHLCPGLSPPRAAMRDSISSRHILPRPCSGELWSPAAEQLRGQQGEPDSRRQARPGWPEPGAGQPLPTARLGGGGTLLSKARAPLAGGRRNEW